MLKVSNPPCPCPPRAKWPPPDCGDRWVARIADGWDSGTGSGMEGDWTTVLWALATSMYMLDACFKIINERSQDDDRPRK